jgi:hypothetical protein
MQTTKRIKPETIGTAADRAIAILAKQEYEAFQIDDSGLTIGVYDPVMVYSGSESWKEYDCVKINLYNGMKELWRFLEDRI